MFKYLSVFISSISKNKKMAFDYSTNKRNPTAHRKKNWIVSPVCVA